MVVIKNAKPKPKQIKEESNTKKGYKEIFQLLYTMSSSPINENPPTINTNSADHLKELVVKYVKTNNPKLYILTPCYGGVCNVDYLTSLINTISLFKEYNIPLLVEFCKNDSLITRARNNLIAKAMNDKDMTDIIFIDSDINWEPYDVLKLLISGKSLVGGAYPLKMYKWNNLSTQYVGAILDRKKKSILNDKMSDDDYLRCNMVNYNLNYINDKIQINENLAKVRHIATGFMMIKREVFETMFDAFPSLKYVDDVGFLTKDENKYAYSLFDCGVEDGHYLSEDWLFCHRWNKMNGDIFIDVSINLNHIGSEIFKGSYLSSIV
jgi:hypothetical protein